MQILIFDKRTKGAPTSDINQDQAFWGDQAVLILVFFPLL